MGMCDNVIEKWIASGTGTVNASRTCKKGDAKLFLSSSEEAINISVGEFFINNRCKIHIYSVKRGVLGEVELGLSKPLDNTIVRTATVVMNQEL